jgi:DNA-binding transcriptional LysR family regulator
MNIAAIQTFLAVVRSRNLNRAAAELNVTQSAVTARLDALEQALGARLMIRSRKGAQLTKAGYAFLEQAELIVRTWDRARAQAGLPTGVTRLFSLVCQPGLWQGLGAPWVAAIRRDHPGTALDIWAGLANDARDWLSSGVSDAALLTEPLAGAGLDSRPFATDELLQVSSRPRAAGDWDPAYVFVDYGPAFRITHAAAWPGDETAATSFSTPDWALAHLLAEGGTAYLPLRLVAPFLTGGQLHEVAGAERVALRSFLTWRKASEDSFAWLASAP